MLKLGDMIGRGGAAVAALSLVLSPAAAAPTPGKAPAARGLSLRSSTFTPAVSDPRLAAELARRGLQANSFRLTPAPAGSSTSKSVRVAIRARGLTPDAAVHRAAEDSGSPVTAITPTVYNLGVSIGWKRFALSGDVDRVRGGPIRGGRDAAELGVSFSGNRFVARAEAGVTRADAATPRIIGDDQSYMVGVGGSYRLGRNIDVLGGVKYKIQRDRLEPLADQRRESQAVYVGTAFRF